jgi:hypothetical protein
VPTRWFWTGNDGEKHGPFTPLEFKDLAASGQLLPTDWVKKDGMTKSVKATRIKGLFAPAVG